MCTVQPPGVTWTLMLVKGQYRWPIVAQNVGEHVVVRVPTEETNETPMSSHDARPAVVAMRGARDGPQGMKKVSIAGKGHPLVVVDRVSRLEVAYPLESKDFVCVARKLLELLLTFGMPLSIRYDSEREYTADVVTHLCQWSRTQRDQEHDDISRVEGVVGMIGGWIHETLAELCKSWSGRWDKCAGTPCWIELATPKPRPHSGRTPVRIL